MRNRKNLIAKSLFECGKEGRLKKPRKHNWDENSPTRESMRASYVVASRKYSGLRIKTIERLVRSHVGKPFNDLYSYLSRNNDKRTYEGYILFEKFKQMFAKHGWERCGFFVDENGIIREKKYTFERWPNYQRGTEDGFGTLTYKDGSVEYFINNNWRRVVFIYDPVKAEKLLNIPFPYVSHELEFRLIQAKKGFLVQ